MLRDQLWRIPWTTAVARIISIKYNQFIVWFRSIYIFWEETYVTFISFPAPLPAGCSLGGELYQDGHLLTDDDACIAVRCVDGKWTNDNYMNSECEACLLLSSLKRLRQIYTNNILLFQCSGWSLTILAGRSCIVQDPMQTIVTFDRTPYPQGDPTCRYVRCLVAPSRSMMV